MSNYYFSDEPSHHRYYYYYNSDKRHILRIIGILQVTIGIVVLAWMPFPMLHVRGAETTFADMMHNTFAAIQVLLILISIGRGIIAYVGKRFRQYTLSLGTLVTLLALGSLSFLIHAKLVPQEVSNWFGLIESITAMVTWCGL